MTARSSTSPTYRWNAIVGVTFLVLSVLAWLGLPLVDLSPETALDITLTLFVLGLALLVIYAVGAGLSWFDQHIITGHQREVSYRFVQLLAIATAIGVVMVPIWEFRVGDVLLGAGAITVLLAIAARKTLGSILSGVIIMATDLFRVGDWVKIDERFGRIDQISLFNTQIRSPQDEIHIFPNDEIIERDITNLGHDRYRNDVLIGIDYDTSIPHAIDICNDVLAELTETDDNRVDGFNPTSVKGFEDSQITLAIKMWVHEPTPTVINEAQTTVLAALHEQFQEEDIEIPFPQRTVSERGDGS